MAQLQRAVQTKKPALPVQAHGFEGQIVLSGLIRQGGAGVVERERVIAIVNAGVVGRGLNRVGVARPGESAPRGQLFSGIGVAATQVIVVDIPITLVLLHRHAAVHAVGQISAPSRTESIAALGFDAD